MTIPIVVLVVVIVTPILRVGVTRVNRRGKDGNMLGRRCRGVDNSGSWISHGGGEEVTSREDALERGGRVQHGVMTWCRRDAMVMMWRRWNLGGGAKSVEISLRLNYEKERNGGIFSRGRKSEREISSVRD